MKEETVKMIEKIEPLIDRIEVKDKKGDEMMDNMKIVFFIRLIFIKLRI